VIDLHTHSTFSDGSETPEVLAQKAAEVGLRAIALTDHDTTSSHEDMAAACDKVGIELVNGCEISLADSAFPVMRDGEAKARGVHVLVYFLSMDPTDPVQQLLARLRQDRLNRNLHLLEKLQALGFEKLTHDDLVARAHRADSVGRPHFAKAMFELHPELVGHETDDGAWQRVFADYLGSSGKAYLPKTNLSIEEFVAAAKGTGAIFSAAHPFLNYLDSPSPDNIMNHMPAVIDSLKQRGFSGIESHYGSLPLEVRSLMVKLTRDAGMIPTGGSDYHGAFKEGVRLGYGLQGDLNVPNEILDELKDASRLAKSAN
jgi:3',5'-nucleoside bisphosphate phosphatase